MSISIPAINFSILKNPYNQTIGIRHKMTCTAMLTGFLSTILSFHNQFHHNFHQIHVGLAELLQSFCVEYLHNPNPVVAMVCRHQGMTGHNSGALYLSIHAFGPTSLQKTKKQGKILRLYALDLHLVAQS